jgi:hypothetical protein
LLTAASSAVLMRMCRIEQVVEGFPLSNVCEMRLAMNGAFRRVPSRLSERTTARTV